MLVEVLGFPEEAFHVNYSFGVSREAVAVVAVVLLLGSQLWYYVHEVHNGLLMPCMHQFCGDVLGISLGSNLKSILSKLLSFCNLVFSCIQ
jgi:hypothetical protein